MKELHIDWKSIENLDEETLLKAKEALSEGDIDLGALKGENYLLYGSPIFKGVYQISIMKGCKSIIGGEQSFLEGTDVNDILLWAKDVIEQRIGDDAILTSLGYKRRDPAGYERMVNKDYRVMVFRLKNGTVRYHRIGGKELLRTHLASSTDMKEVVFEIESEYLDVGNVSYMNNNLRDFLLNHGNTGTGI